MKSLSLRINSLLLGSFISIFLIISSGCTKNNEPSAELKDVEDNVYQTISIGRQVWMAENLKTTKFRDSTSIQKINYDCYYGSRASYGWYNNDSVNKDIYGALYSFRAVETGLLCPAGWHIPRDEEWSELINYLDGDFLAGGKLKEIGLIHWSDPNKEADNSSGFTALPGGSHPGWYLVTYYVGIKMFFREESGFFFNLGNEGAWWSSTKTSSGQSGSADSALGYKIGYQSGNIKKNVFGYKNSFSIRCIKDN